jgi:hypothetical protein
VRATKSHTDTKLQENCILYKCMMDAINWSAGLNIWTLYAECSILASPVTRESMCVSDNKPQRNGLVYILCDVSLIQRRQSSIPISGWSGLTWARINPYFCLFASNHALQLSIHIVSVGRRVPRRIVNFGVYLLQNVMFCCYYISKFACKYLTFFKVFYAVHYIWQFSESVMNVH